jgi:hypothetical protein
LVTATHLLYCFSKVYEKLQKFIEIIDTDLADIQNTGTDKIKGACFIHSAGFGQFVTDESQRERILTKHNNNQVYFELFHPFITKFIYIGTAVFFRQPSRIN